MLYRTVLSALVAGVVAGTALSVLQRWTTVPIIEQSERYETRGALAHPESRADEPSENELARAAYTAMGDVLVAVGFGMLLSALYVLRGKSGLLGGIASGLAGFMTFHLGPAAIVPPAIPALHVASLQLRQCAWLVAVAFTGGGMALLAFGRGAARYAGVLLLLLPFCVFRYWLELPVALSSSHDLSHLERLFVVRSLGSNLVCWLILGAVSGWIFEQSSEPPAT